MIGIPDPKWTERPLLIVVPHPQHRPSKDELLAFLKVPAFLLIAHLGSHARLRTHGVAWSMQGARACGMAAQGKVAKWWVPEHVVFVAELPHTATGKLSKLTLRKQFQDFRPEQAKL